MRKFLSVFTGATAVVLMMATGTAIAADNRGIHVCLRGTSSCLNLKNDSFATFTNTIVLAGRSGKGLGWQKERIGTVCSGGHCGRPRPFAPHSGLNAKFSGRPVYVIWKTKGSKRNGCIYDDGGDGRAFTARWTRVEKGVSFCGAHGNSVYKGMWVYTTSHYLVSVGYSFDNAQGVQPGVMTTTSRSTGTLVKIEPIGNTRFQKWTLP